MSDDVGDGRSHISDEGGFIDARGVRVRSTLIEPAEIINVGLDSTTAQRSSSQTLRTPFTPPAGPMLTADAASKSSTAKQKVKLGGRGAPQLRVSTGVIQKTGQDVSDLDSDEAELFVVRIKVPDGRSLTTSLSANATVAALKRSLAPMLMALPVPAILTNVVLNGCVIQDEVLVSEIPGLVSGRDSGLKLVLPDELVSPKGKLQRCTACDRYMSTTCVTCGAFVCFYCLTRNIAKHPSGASSSSASSSHRNSLEPEHIFSPTWKTPSDPEGGLPASLETLTSPTTPSPRMSFGDTSAFMIECAKCTSTRVEREIREIKANKLRMVMVVVLIVLCVISVLVIIMVLVRGPRDPNDASPGILSGY